MKQKRKKFRQQMAVILATCMIGTTVPADMVFAADLSDGTGEVMQQPEIFPEEDALLQEEAPNPEGSEQEIPNQEALEQENGKDVLQPETEMPDEEAVETSESETPPQDVLTGDTEELFLDDSSEEEMLSAGDESEGQGEAKTAGQLQPFAMRSSYSEADLSEYGTADVAKTCSIYEGRNIESQNYTYNWSSVIDSYLVLCSDGSIMRVQNGAVKGQILVEYYDASYNFKKSLTVALELPIFGGFYEMGNYYYVLTGQKNPKKSDSVEVFRITKYTKDWQKVCSCGLYGANTTVPFDAGSARMTANGKYLMIRTCHEMYGGHQANVTIQVDTDNMTITDSHTEVAFSPYGYVSHSFNQFIASDNGNIVTVDHGDAYPRKIVLYKNEGGSDPKEITMLSYPGATGDNYTGATVGSFQISDSSYLVAGSYDTKWGDDDTRKVFISAVPKSGGTANVIYYSDYQAEGGAASTPYLVKLNNNSFMLMWSCQGYVYYTKVNGNGQKVGTTYKMKGNLSDCEPQVINGKITWYTWKNERNVFYEINVNDPSKKYVAVIDNGHDFECGTTVTNGEAVQTCKRCGVQEKVAVPTEIRKTEWSCNNHSFFEYMLPETNFEAGSEIGCEPWLIYSSEAPVKNKEIDVSVSDTSVLSIKDKNEQKEGRVTFIAKKPGKAEVTIRVRKNPAVSQKATVYIDTIENARITVKGDSGYVYDGKEKKPEILVTARGLGFETKPLKENTDFKVEYKNNVNAGTAQFTVKGIGKYAGIRTGTFQIRKAPQELKSENLKAEAGGVPVTLSAKLVKGDGKLSYVSDNPEIGEISGNTFIPKKAGTAKITVTASETANYEKTSQYFWITVDKFSVDNCAIEAPKSLRYTGQALTPEVKVTYKDKVLKKGQDYNVSYQNNRNVGTAQIQVNGIGDYRGSKVVSFEILKGLQEISASDLVVKQGIQAVSFGAKLIKGNGELTYYSHNPDIVKISGNKFIPLKPGTAVVDISALGNSLYEKAVKTIKVTVTATARNLASCTVEPVSPISYNGKERRPEVTVKDGSYILKKDTDYTVTYTNNIKAGTAQITLKGKGNYTGTLIKYFTIQKANQKVAVYDRLVPGKYITSASKRLDSKTLTLKGAVLQGNKTGKFSFKSDNPYVATVTSWGRITFTGVGTVRITATTKGSGNYNPASVTFTLTVLPSPTAITKLQSQKPNWLNIQYRANRKADGYQIQYGTSPDMKGVKYAAVNNSATRSYTRKDVTSGATYYVRVRTFNVVNGKRYYSNWSGIKSMKVK